MIYILKADFMYKIGITQNLNKRIKSLQTGCPFPLEIEFQFETHNDYEIEQLLHLKYKKQNSIGEWFKLSLKDIENIKSEIIAFNNISSLSKNKHSHKAYTFDVDLIFKNVKEYRNVFFDELNTDEKRALATLINEENKNKYLSFNDIHLIINNFSKKSFNKHFTKKIIDYSFKIQNYSN